MKVLIVRFSSIGDIVLTTPIIRCLKQQLKDAEVHYITKQKFNSVVQHNPYIDKIYLIDKSTDEVIDVLKSENYDYIIDLHHNVRTFKLKQQLAKKAFAFNKLNWKKFLVVNFKINKLPNIHIVDRYFETLKSLGVVNDNKGLDYFISDKEEVEIEKVFPSFFHLGYYCLVVGGSYFTKQIPLNKLQEICEKSTKPLILLGGKEDEIVAHQLHQMFPQTTFNACGLFNLNQSASVVKQSVKVITSDTGIMHIASAYKKEIISLWGNTIPEFGMYPYLPGPNSKILEVKNLSCRPCSKLGYKKCPKGHFKCMNNIEIPEI